MVEQKSLNTPTLNNARTSGQRGKGPLIASKMRRNAFCFFTFISARGVWNSGSISTVGLFSHRQIYEPGVARFSGFGELRGAPGNHCHNSWLFLRTQVVSVVRRRLRNEEKGCATKGDFRFFVDRQLIRSGSVAITQACE